MSSSALPFEWISWICSYLILNHLTSYVYEETLSLVSHPMCIDLNSRYVCLMLNFGDGQNGLVLH